MDHSRLGRLKSLRAPGGANNDEKKLDRKEKRQECLLGE